MTTELYVGNLPLTFTEAALRELLSPHGLVTEVRFRLDRRARGPHRFAFVTMATSDGAAAAIFGLNGRELDGRELRVKQSRPPGEELGDDADGRRSPGRFSSSRHRY